MTMKHRYRITVEPLPDASQASEAHTPALQFEVSNHDDILAIVERLQARGDLEPDSATALAVGLKLFGEVMLEHRQHPLFAPLKDAFPAFMKQLKQGPVRPDREE
jgi:hypothetical protein